MIKYRKCVGIIFGMILTSLSIQAQQKLGHVFGGSKLDRGIFISKTSDNALLIVGFTESFSNSSDMYVIKTEVDGTKLWERNLGGKGSDAAWSFEEVDNGTAYLIAGFSDSYGNGDDIVLVKITSDGNVVWSKNLPNPENERCWSIKRLIDGNFILVGQSQDRVTKNYDGLITKIDPEGSVVWQKKYGGLEYDRLFYCTESMNKELIVAGISRADSLAENSGWVLRLDQQGDQLKSTSLRSIKNITTHGVLTLSKSEILIYGYAQTDTAHNQRSIYLALFDEKGNLSWERTTTDKSSINHGLSAILNIFQ